MVPMREDNITIAEKSMADRTDNIEGGLLRQRTKYDY
jgi:hypothetical protein